MPPPLLCHPHWPVPACPRVSPRVSAARSRSRGAVRMDPKPKPDDLILAFEGGSVAAALTGMEASSRQNPFAASPAPVGISRPPPSPSACITLGFMVGLAVGLAVGFAVGLPVGEKGGSSLYCHTRSSTAMWVVFPFFLQLVIQLQTQPPQSARSSLCSRSEERRVQPILDMSDIG